MNSNLLSLVFVIQLGFLLGLRHALDADHIAAVSTILRGKQTLKASSRIGALWGAGHMATLVAAGIIVLGLKISLPTGFEKYAELGVGFMLVALGIRPLYKIRKIKAHYHSHEHGGVTHAHMHSHENSPKHNHNHVPFAVGMLHGLAGSAPLILLATAAAPSVFAGILYIAVFGIGSILGMLAISGGMGLFLNKVSQFPVFEKSFQMAAGILSIAIGFHIILN
jgi:sulfite exporter TauE/SafE